ncbi:hypothetical protein M408DRAFT_25082 [Serendipita vermifera MAFF 305830]|uniref:MYND-type domain-containing protein n=1 Tax=Serendipita vermifera MAFF 305830 TaxID=933852 RepID=A0A0C2WKE5_SERVB|nr:hypothetical protein M408DRAFT_25082 [Serendipita vermifera MAFF 305830]
MSESESLFDSLPEFIKATHWTSPGHKEWRYCAYCKRCQNDDFKVHRCKGCAQKKGPQVFYCGRKCQMQNWSNHKHWCLLGKADTDPSNERSTKVLSRWMRTNVLVLRWCVEQAYHYTPGANPSTTLVSFWIDGETSKISRITLRKRDNKESRCFKPMPYLYTVHLEHPNTPDGSLDTSYHQFDGFTSTEMQQTVVGHPQFPWIAATVFGSLKQTSPSAQVAEKRLSLLCAAVTHHTSNGSLVLPKLFNAGPVACSLRIPSTQMLLWNYKLKSIDLWEPFNNPKQMPAFILDPSHQLRRPVLGSEPSSDKAKTAVVDHSACYGGCHGHA